MNVKHGPPTVVAIPSRDAPLTVGAVHGRLAAAGYAAVSALVPDFGDVFAVAPPLDLVCEHPAAIRTGGGLIALLLRPIGDAELARRVRVDLDSAGFTAGPRYVGTDGVTAWVLRDSCGPFASKSALGGSVRFTSGLLPLNPEFYAALLATSAGQLPEVADASVAALLTELDALPAQLVVERTPPAPPRKSAWLGR